MLTSLAFIFLVGLSLAAICQALKLPRIIGMLITGILLGLYVLNVLDPSILSISSELRQIALIIILLKAGLSLNLADLKKVGRPAIMMACIPATFEILAYFLLAPYFLGITRLEAAVMGAVMGAVSPAVVVPRMVQLMDEKYGTAKSIPQMILAGASCDDIYVIVLFSTFSTMAQGGSAHLKDFINIPVSIILGIALGSVAGYLLSLFFETAYAHSHMVRNSMKVIVVMGVAFLLMSIETWLKPVVSVSGLLAVISMACVLKLKCTASVSARLSQKFGKLWLAAEVLLFVLVGASVDIRYTLKAVSCCPGHDLCSTSDPYPGRFSLCYRNKPNMAGKTVLFHCLPSESNRTGSDWVCSNGYGTFLRADRAFCGCTGNSDHCTTWSNRDGLQL